jgi:hypothetical protein
MSTQIDGRDFRLQPIEERKDVLKWLLKKHTRV